MGSCVRPPRGSPQTAREAGVWGGIWKTQGCSSSLNKRQAFSTCNNQSGISHQRVTPREQQDSHSKGLAASPALGGGWQIRGLLNFQAKSVAPDRLVAPSVAPAPFQLGQSTSPLPVLPNVRLVGLFFSTAL